MIKPPDGYVDITNRKPLKECTTGDLNGTFYNIKHDAIGTQRVYSETSNEWWADLTIGHRHSEGCFYKDSDKVFPPLNYLKIKKVPKKNEAS